MKFNTSAPTSSGFIKLKDYVGAKALLIEVRSVNRDVPSPKYGLRDQVVADWTIFANEDQLNGTESPTVIKRGTLDKGKRPNGSSTAMIEAFADMTGEGAIYRVEMKTADGIANPFAQLVEVDQAVAEKVIAYYNKREGELKAEAAEAPNFLDS